MSIKDKRLKQAVENIIREELRSGEFPSSKKVLWRINQYIQEHDLNAPEHTLRPARPGYRLDPDAYNLSHEEILRDLSILYECMIGFYNDSLASFKEFDIEKSKYEYKLRVLEKQLEELIMVYSNKDIMGSVYDTFSNMENIDFSATNASIDIDKQEVTLAKTMETYSFVQPPDGTTVTFEVPPTLDVISKVATGNINNVLLRYKNVVWQQEVSSSKQIPITGTLTVRFPSPIQINRICMDLHSIKNTLLDIEISPDGNAWTKITKKSINAIDNAVVDFTTTNIRAVRISMTKSEADKLLSTKGAPTYLYLYGFKGITFYITSYKDKSVFQSKAFEVLHNRFITIDNVSLYTKEEIPNGTSIKYYIALDKPQPNWIPILPMQRTGSPSEKVVKFNNIENAQPEIFNFPSNISIENVRQLTHLNVNGVKFYRLGAISNRYIIPGSERLFCGKEFLKVDSFVKNQPEGYVPSDTDWKDFSTTYQRITSSSIASGKAVPQYSNIRYSCAIHSAEEQRVASHKLVSNGPCAVYLNGDLLFAGVPNVDTKVDYYFKKGWNNLVFIVYCPTTNLTLDVGMNILNKGEHIYAIGTPYELVDIFDLQYNIRNNRKDVYSIVTINDEAVLVLNHYVPDIDYEFFYRYASKSNIKMRILFKAELSRDPDVTSLSPKLKEYTLRFS